eukprot:266494-Rhodomonas_salina.1
MPNAAGSRDSSSRWGRKSLDPSHWKALSHSTLWVGVAPAWRKLEKSAGGRMGKPSWPISA